MTAELTHPAIRDATPADAEHCGRIFYAAFDSIASRHGFPVEADSSEFTRWKVQALLDDPHVHAFVAERDGAVVGSVFLDERSSIVGVGPVSVDPQAMDAGTGRALMEAALERERDRRVAGVRLVQTAYHYRSLALYTKFAFEVREPLSVLQGDPPAVTLQGYDVRSAREDDVAACAELCVRVHGHERARELSDAIVEGAARVVERGGRLTGYATGAGYAGHAVAETNDDLKALLGSAERFTGLGVLVPSRNGDLLRWCLENRLRIVQQSTLMTIGLYNEPRGAYLPSIQF
jgi:predicted N-acetyltransferase YhbS